MGAWLSNVDLVKVIITAVLVPLAGAAWIAWRRARAAVRHRQTRIAFLSGFPPEAKAVLMQFHDQRAHTLRLNPCEPGALLLIRKNVLSRAGTAGGAHDAVDCYVSVAPEFWEVMDEWAMCHELLGR